MAARFHPLSAQKHLATWYKNGVRPNEIRARLSLEDMEQMRSLGYVE